MTGTLVVIAVCQTVVVALLCFELCGKFGVIKEQKRTIKDQSWTIEKMREEHKNLTDMLDDTLKTSHSLTHSHDEKLKRIKLAILHVLEDEGC